MASVMMQRFKALNMPLGAIPSNEIPEGGSPVRSAPADPPAWMKVRRERQAVERPVEPPREVSLIFESLESPVTPPEPPAHPPELPARLESTLANLEIPPVTLRARSRRKKSALIPKFLREHWLVLAARNRLAQWISKQTAISLSCSLALHSFVLLTLAFIVITHAKAPEPVSLWSGDGDIGEGGGGGDDILIDTAVPFEASGDPGSMILDQVTQNLETLPVGGMGGMGGIVTDAISKGNAGKGGKEGDGSGGGAGSGGSGVGFGVGGIKVPGHAQTKGSFSAWADPRDPKPGQDYFIVIRIELPKNIKKYRGSDLTGSVKGTDAYKQDIKFQPGEHFPVEDGAVVVRIRVPGAARLVRDSIKVESKLLKEKQEFEIEF